MGHIRLESRRTGNEEWIPIDDEVFDEDGYLQFFGIEMPNGKYHNVHLVRHRYPLSDLAVQLFSAATSLRSAKGLLEELEAIAARSNWYNAKSYPGVAKHAGKAGLVLGSAALLHSFLETRPFDAEGYYNAEGKKIVSPPIHKNDRNEYRR